VSVRFAYQSNQAPQGRYRWLCLTWTADVIPLEIGAAQTWEPRSVTAHLMKSGVFSGRGDAVANTSCGGKLVTYYYSKLVTRDGLPVSSPLFTGV